MAGVAVIFLVIVLLAVRGRLIRLAFRCGGRRPPAPDAKSAPAHRMTDCPDGEGRSGTDS